MKAFTFDAATDLRSAVEALSEDPTAKPLAGGTNLVDLMKLGVETPDRVIGIDGIELGGIVSLADGGLRVGANVRNSDFAADLLVRTRFPLLSEALLSAASGQLRNMASTGGNLLQRTRCVYFMDTSKPCNKREPGSGCPAIPGLSRELAILGGSEHCIATHPGDLAVALTALGAIIHFETVDGQSSLAIEDFYRLPEDRPELDTNLPHGAIITAVEIPGLPFATNSTYRKARDRRSYAFGLTTVAAALDIEDGIVRDVRIALGGVAHKPWRATVAEQLLRGGPATIDAFERAAEAELSAAMPTDDNAFKVALARRMLVGVLHELAGGHEQGGHDGEGAE